MKPIDMKRSILIAGTLTAFATPAIHADLRASASYAIATESADAGGNRATSTTYTNDASLGGIAGISTVAAPAETAKSGYVGQLYEVTALQLSTTSATVNEGGTLQLAGTQLLDDGSTLDVAANAIGWSVQSGPLTGISATGLATADNVYQATLAIAQGSYAGLSSTLNLTVLNVNSDNFGTYAGDGIDDAWQVQYFGQPPNARAAPNFVSDGSGLTNLFKYTAGLAPNNPAATFTVLVNPVPGQPTQRAIVISPTFADRTYTVEYCASPPSWSTLSGSYAGTGGALTVTDANASNPSKFYRVKVAKP